jgi:hypothetical protein
MKKLIPLTKSPRFVRFTSARDKGLELMLAKYSDAISAVVDTLKRRSEEIAARSLVKMPNPNAMKASRDGFEHQLRPTFTQAVQRIEGLVQTLRRSTFVLTAGSQSYAIAKTCNTKLVVHNTSDSRYVMALGELRHKEMQLGGTVMARIDLALSRLLRDVVDAFQMNQVMGGTPEECLARIARAFPTAKEQKRPPKVMARLKEADLRLVRPRPDLDEPDINTQDFFTEAEWQAAVDDYLSEEIPYGRAPYDQIFYADTENAEVYTRYQWQVEAEITDDFVDAVRDGENYAANAQGINDFQFIAIVDAKTDECCAERDGLTFTEINEKLDNGEIEQGENEEAAPPVHFNCRCRVAPMTTDMPEEEGADWSAFDDWLNSGVKNET